MSKSPDSLLVTGFDAFGSFESNPSETLARHLGESIAGVSYAILPTSYERSIVMLRNILAERKPRGVVLFGVAQRTKGFYLEHRASLISDSSVVDNDGAVAPRSSKTAQGYRTSSLPLDALRLALQRAGLPVIDSFAAGGYVCNWVFDSLLSILHEQDTAATGGLVHVTPIEQGFTGPDGLRSHLSYEELILGGEALCGAMLDLLGASPTDDACNP